MSSPGRLPSFQRGEPQLGSGIVGLESQSFEAGRDSAQSDTRALRLDVEPLGFPRDTRAAGASTDLGRTGSIPVTVTGGLLTIEEALRQETWWGASRLGEVGDIF